MAFVGVRERPPVTETAFGTALTKTCVLETTSAEMSALAPFPDKSVTATETGFLYPDPKLKSARYSVAVPEPTYA